ncbi:MAG: preprotein translocase subunit SecE [Chloracidobacterium sp.]|nr:preprotein translocase subunit SecE [Chloracidobacterium sp.]
MSEAVAKQKEGIGEFITKTRAELDKTTFPSSDDVKGTTIIVIINVIFFAVYLFLIDQGWVYFVEALTWVINQIAGA